MDFKEHFEDEPCFQISVVAKMLDLHPQTIRNYERMGLISPSRTKGNVRLFSANDIRKLKQIASYTELGVNLAGVEIIVRLLEQMEEMKGEMEREIEEMKRKFKNLE